MTNLSCWHSKSHAGLPSSSFSWDNGKRFHSALVTQLGSQGLLHASQTLASHQEWGLVHRGRKALLWWDFQKLTSGELPSQGGTVAPGPPAVGQCGPRAPKLALCGCSSPKAAQRRGLLNDALFFLSF